MVLTSIWVDIYSNVIDMSIGILTSGNNSTTNCMEYDFSWNILFLFKHIDCLTHDGITASILSNHLYIREFYFFLNLITDVMILTINHLSLSRSYLCCTIGNRCCNSKGTNHMIIASLRV